jgi:Uma2 family endonuclease
LDFPTRLFARVDFGGFSLAYFDADAGAAKGVDEALGAWRRQGTMNVESSSVGGSRLGSGKEKPMSILAPSTGRAPAVLYDIDWPTYTRLLRVLQSRRRFRLTYDRGTLEIMSPLWEHEAPAYLIGRFIDALTDELHLPCRAGRSVTLRRRKKKRGLEADNCYWIASAARLQGKTHLDLRTDPPPDLAIEVDVTRSSLDRMSIYAALNVPEVWRLSSAGIAFHVLDGSVYQVRSHSLAFPQLASADLPAFLAQLGQIDDTTLVKQFRDWVRRELLHRPPPVA